MAFSDRLLEIGSDVWAAQYEHPFVRELAAGNLDEAAFRHWIEQDYRSLHDYARLFAIATTKADDETTMTHLLGVAHRVLDEELELHSSFAADYGIDEAALARVEKAPTCVAYTNVLVRTGYEGSIAEIAAALFPCMQGSRDVGAHMAELADGEHRYTPFIETFTSEEFRETTARTRAFVDRCGEAFPGQHDAMEAAFLRSTKLEYRFWEMAYTRERWGV